MTEPFCSACGERTFNCPECHKPIGAGTLTYCGDEGTAHTHYPECKLGVEFWDIGQVGVRE